MVVTSLRLQIQSLHFHLSSLFSFFWIYFSCEVNDFSHFHNAVSYVDSSPSVSWTVLNALCFKISVSQKQNFLLTVWLKHRKDRWLNLLQFKIFSSVFPDFNCHFFTISFLFMYSSFVSFLIPGTQQPPKSNRNQYQSASGLCIM